MKSYIIAGPTASGKTKAGIFLAKKIGGEIISCDSMQVYRDIPICSAAPDEDELRQVPHHLVGFLDFSEKFSVVAWRKMAMEKMNEISARGKVPIFVGGTGLYVHSLIYRPDFFAHSDEKLRKELDLVPSKELVRRVKEICPDSSISDNDRKRLIRFLEIYSLTGKIPESTDWKQKNDEHDFTLFCISPERNVLYERINSRVDKMLALGLEKEIFSLMQRGVSEQDQCYKAIGCRQFIEYFNGTVTKDEAIENIKRDSRRYAKRQLTWMRAEDAIWLGENAEEQLEEFCERI